MKNTKKNWQPFALMFLISLVSFVAGILMARMDGRRASDIALLDRLEEVKRLPEKDFLQLKQKVLILQGLEKDIPRAYQLYRQLYVHLHNRQVNLQSLRILEHIAGNYSTASDPFNQWLQMSILKRKLGEPLPEHLEKAYLDLERSVLNLLHARSGELTQLLQEKRHDEIITRTTPDLLRFMDDVLENLAVSEEIKGSWQDLSRLYRDALQEQQVALQQKSLRELNTRLEEIHLQLQAYKKTLRGWMMERRYTLAEQGLEDIWNSIYSLENVNPRMPLVVEVKSTIEEIQGIQVLFFMALSGLEKQVGGEVDLQLRDGTRVVGVLQKAEMRGVEILSVDKKNVRITLKNLHAKDIVNLITPNNSKILKSVVLFLLYENQVEEAKVFAQKGEAMGLPASFFEKHYQRIHKSLADK